MGEGDDREFEPESEGSLEQFEEELIQEEKKSARSKSLTSVLIVILLLAGGGYAYLNFFAAKDEPTPPVKSAALQNRNDGPVAKSENEEDLWVGDEVGKTAEKEGEESTVKEEPAITSEDTEKEKLPLVASDAKKPSKTKQPAEPEKVAVKVPAKKTVTKAEPVIAVAVKSDSTESKPSSGNDSKTYAVQVGFYVIPKNADTMMKQVKKLGFTPSSKKVVFKSKKMVVWEGRYKFRELAQDMAELLSKQGFKPKVVLTGPGNYSLKMGVGYNEAKADALVNSMEERGFSARIETGKGGGKEATIVRIENISGRQQLVKVQAALKEAKIENFAISR